MFAWEWRISFGTIFYLFKSYNFSAVKKEDNNLSAVTKSCASFFRSKAVASWILSKVRKPSLLYFSSKLTALLIIKLSIGHLFVGLNGLTGTGRPTQQDFFCKGFCKGFSRSLTFFSVKPDEEQQLRNCSSG